jgi:hypothetical protein
VKLWRMNGMCFQTIFPRVMGIKLDGDIRS